MSTPRELLEQAIAHESRGGTDQALALARRAASAAREAELIERACALLARLGEREQAIFHLRRACQAFPSRARSRLELAGALRAAGRVEEASAEARRAAELDPRSADAWAILAGVELKRRAFDACESAARRAIELEPDHPEASATLGVALLRSARARESAAVLRRDARRRPRDPSALLRLATTLNYTDDATPRETRAAHEALGRAISAAAGPPDADLAGFDRDPDRVLRVGYLSADLRDHSVAFFAEPFLERHDRGRVEVVVYSSTPEPDAVTARLRGIGHAWRDVARLPDPELLALIRRDRIDVLVDLSGHTGGSRAGVLARRAAPVQATYLGYPSTTGLAAMDWRLVDSTTDPPGAEAHSTERLARLDPCFLCYHPPTDAPEARPREPGPAVFGSFNTALKITPTTLDAWAGVLTRVPGSRLVLKNAQLSDDSLRARLREELARRAIDSARVEFLGLIEDRRGHLDAYARIDVALDTMPYAGTTTTCEALWMGVPVVTRLGDTHAGRVGASILGTAGLSELIARDARQFVEIAAALASDAPRLAALRAGLRARISGSSLVDASAFTARLEAAYRAMWRSWCGSG